MFLIVIKNKFTVQDIVTGYTISIILLFMGIDQEREEPEDRKNNKQHQTTAKQKFHGQSTDTHVQARRIPKTLKDKVAWAQIPFEPKKSRALIIRKGKITSEFKKII